jgi:hypothetical protein
MAGSAQAKVSGGVGVVVVATLEISIGPLSMTEEKLLNRRLQIAATAALEDPYTNAKKTLKAAEDNPLHLRILLAEIATIATRKPFLSVQDFDDYRQSPAGVAAELFARGKRLTPGLKETELATIVTAFNAEDVHESMMAIIADKGDDDQKKADQTP